MSGNPTGPLVLVDDPSDIRLADYRDLTDPAARRRLETERSIVVVEGRLSVERLLGSGFEVRSLLVDDRQAVAASGLVDAVRARGAPVFLGRRDLVAATVGFAFHRGVVAIARRPADADPVGVVGRAASTPGEGGTRRVVAVLEGLNDHENIGALFRNAAAFGVAAVLLDPTCADPLYRRSIRVSVGHVLQVPFARLPSWPGGLDLLRSAGFLIAALAPHPAAGGTEGRPSMTLSRFVADDRGTPAAGGAARPVALVFGAEGAGLSAGAMDASDVWVSIPMAGGVDSLNVATAAALAFHGLAGTDPPGGIGGAPVPVGHPDGAG